MQQRLVSRCRCRPSGDTFPSQLEERRSIRRACHDLARNRLDQHARYTPRDGVVQQERVRERAAGAATGTINRETSALHRMCTLAVHWGWLDTVPGFPDRLRENSPRQGFFEHPEYLAVRAHLPAPWQDILDLTYYSVAA